MKTTLSEVAVMHPTGLLVAACARRSRASRRGRPLG